VTKIRPTRTICSQRSLAVNYTNIIFFKYLIFFIGGTMTGYIVRIVFSPFTNSSILFRYNKSYYRIDLIIGASVTKIRPTRTICSQRSLAVNYTNIIHDKSIQPRHFEINMTT
jgi:hypothetical protein